MACDLTTGRAIPCLDAKPGIDDIYFIPRTALGKDAFTLTGNEVTGLDILITEAFKYSLGGDDENILNINGNDDSRATGATTFTHEAVVKLKKIDKATSQELGVVAKSRPNVVMKDNDGNYRLLGLSEGCYINVVETSGGAKNSFNGYTVNINSVEFESAPFLDSATIDALEGLVSSTNITP